MVRNMRGLIVGALALSIASIAVTEARAMPVQPLASTAAAQTGVEHIWWRGGWGWRGGYGWRGGWGWRGGYGYGWRRPWGYGWRRPYWGWRRPWGYGFRRW